MKNNEFYDSLSADYNSMLSFDKLVSTRTEALKKFIKSGYINAIDIGCGTGLDSIALTNNGMKVTAFDTSSKMIQNARHNAKERNLRIRFSNSPVQNADKSFHSKYDMIVSLGNAIANIRQDILRKIFTKSYKLLKPGGTILIQILNYEAVRKSDKRIVNITRGKGNLFIRFYDFEKNKLNFNVLKINDNNLQEYSLISTELFEYSRSDIKLLLEKPGFTNIKFYSDLNRTKFHPSTSKDLIVVAAKHV